MDLTCTMSKSRTDDHRTPYNHGDDHGKLIPGRPNQTVTNISPESSQKDQALSLSRNLHPLPCCRVISVPQRRSPNARDIN